MDAATVARGFTELGELAQTEYRQPLTDVADAGNPWRTFYRLGRLAGVHLKRPFARRHKLSQPSAASSAYNAWELVSPAEFEATVAPERAVLDEIRATLSPSNPNFGTLTTYEIVDCVQHESGVFGLLAQVLAPSICADNEIASRIQSAFDQHQAEAEGPRLGAYLSEQIPILDRAGPLVVAAIVSILLTAGPQEFCKATTAWVGAPDA